MNDELDRILNDRHTMGDHADDFGDKRPCFCQIKPAITQLISNAVVAELELFKPKLIGGAREYHDGDTVSINYKKGYTTAQKYLLERLSALTKKGHKDR